MRKYTTYAIVTGRLLLAGLLLVVRWLLQPLYLLNLVILTLSETAINGIGGFIGNIQNMNNELLGKIK
jgi:hypothetical protein